MNYLINKENNNYEFIEIFMKQYEDFNNKPITHLDEILMFKIMIFQRKYCSNYNMFVTKVCNYLNIDEKKYLLNQYYFNSNHLFTYSFTYLFIYLLNLQEKVNL